MLSLWKHAEKKNTFSYFIFTDGKKNSHETFFPLSHLKKPEFKKKILFLVKNISKIFFFSLSFTHKEDNGKVLHIALIHTPKKNSFKLFSHMNITSPELHIFVEIFFFLKKNIQSIKIIWREKKIKTVEKKGFVENKISF